MRCRTTRSIFVSFVLGAAAPSAAAPAVAQGQAVPTPESVLGQPVGADFFLASYDESMRYFEALDAASDRVQLIEVGHTSYGLPWRIALISSAENLRDVERYREISQRLAHPAGLTDEQARQLARDGRAIVHIDAGLHATEVAHAQHAIQLAYDLVSGDADPETRAILDNVGILTRRQQQVVQLYFRENLQQQQIAERLGISQQAVGDSLARARAAVGRKLKSHPVPPATSGDGTLLR